ncbi:MAG: hypothetical protein OMM_09774, partial [Candidatus Magnetoglobus multicellularis str. Araruama]
HPVTGELAVNNPSELNYENRNMYTLTTISTINGRAFTPTLTIHIKDANEYPPVFESNEYNFYVDENSGDATPVGDVNADDLDPTDILVYAISTSFPYNPFNFDNNSGQLTVNGDYILDYEHVPAYTLTVSVNDGKHVDETNVCVSINNLNEYAPIFASETYSFTIAENAAPDSFIGTILASDMDPESIMNFQITAGNAQRIFQIDNAGNFSIDDADGLDFETQSAYTLTVEVSDGSYSDTAQIFVSVTDINVPPVISSIENQSTIINYPISIPFQITDIEGGQMLISISSSNQSLVSPEHISFTGTNIISDGTNYTVHASPSTPENINMVIQPVSGQSGDSIVTMTIGEIGMMTQKAFTFSVLPHFTEDENISLPGVSKGSAAFGDYDNDGDFDILIIGESDTGRIANIYQNLGGRFSEDTGNHISGVNKGSAAFGDYDNDGDLDILITGEISYLKTTAKVYRNTGGSFSEDTGIELPAVFRSSVAFGDYDNDGDLDILITGYIFNGAIAKIYRNTNGSFSEDTGINLISICDSSVAFGDYDNDWDLDILLTGYYKKAKVYRNTDSGFSEDTGINLIGVSDSSAAYGDYDNDGYLDIIITGNSDRGKISKLYKNSGGIFNEDTATNLPGVSNSSVAFGDCDNDGDLDILLSGSSDSGRIAKLYKNTGRVFNEDIDIHLPGVSESSVVLGDYDNDGDLDILLTGVSDNGRIAKVFRNNINIGNLPPSAPANLRTVVRGQKVMLSWSAASDDKPESVSGLSYNLRIGSSSGACDILSPMSLPLSSSYRQIPSKGFIQSLTAIVTINKTGIYYWSVQAIDTSFECSSFSQEYSFVVKDIAPIPGNDGILSSTTLLPNSKEVTISWTIASDEISLTNLLEYRIYTSTVSYGDHISKWEEESTAISDWIQNTNTVTVYNPDESLQYYYVAVIVCDESGNKAIYDPLLMSLYSNMTDIDLPLISSSSAAFGDYDNDRDLDILITGFSSSNGRIAKVYRNSGGTFSEDTDIKLTGVSGKSNSVAFGDYDNDGDLDILLTGSSDSGGIAKIYRNTDGNFIENTEIKLPGVSDNSVAFGDYDNDGNLDILLTGYSGSYLAKVYRNTGMSFSEDTEISLTGISSSSVAFGDYDNDGDLDILIAGSTYSDRIAKVYRNSNGQFTEDVNINLTGVYYCSVAFGDYDNDGDLDILVTGGSYSGLIAKVYENSGGNFNENTEILFPGLFNSSVVFGDYDNDGDLDIFLSGYTGSVYISKIFRNTGFTFSEDTSINLPGVSGSSIAFGDCDNDGDLDILLIGTSSNGHIAQLYRNNIDISNTPPSPPTNLNAEVVGHNVCLSWSAASDAETLSVSGLNYNLYIGSTPGGTDILSPMSLPLSNGYRLLPARGHIQTLTKTIKNLPDGTYYWSVQAIDTAFAGSEFATESSFVIDNLNENAPLVYDQSFTIKETAVNGDKVGQLIARDVDNNLISYYFSNPDAVFAIDPGSGIITVIDDTCLNNDITPQYDLSVNVQDDQFTSYAMLTILVIDGNDDRMVFDQTFSVQENSPQNTLVGTINVEAPPGTRQFTLTSGNINNAFTLHPVTGELTVNNPSELNYEN